MEAEGEVLEAEGGLVQQAGMEVDASCSEGQGGGSSGGGEEDLEEMEEEVEECVDGGENEEEDEICEEQESLVQSNALEEPELSSPHQSLFQNPNEPSSVALDSEQVATAGPGPGHGRELTLGLVPPGSSPPCVDELKGKDMDTESHHVPTEIKQPDDGTAEMEDIQLFTVAGDNGSPCHQAHVAMRLGGESAQPERTERTAEADDDASLPQDGLREEKERDESKCMVSPATPDINKSDLNYTLSDAASTELLLPAQDVAAAEAASDVAAGASGACSDEVKTELQREMELYEAALQEEEEKRELLASVRGEQWRDLEYLSGGDQVMVDLKNEKKRPSESPGTSRKKKRGRRTQCSEAARDPSKEVSREEEDVCFMCFDGGDLVLCDRRTCPKAYHLNCIGRDTAFFQKKGAWICGWHFCCVCTKKASFQCYTCPTGYCATCRKDVDFLCVSKRKGLCEECRPVVMMIERNLPMNAEGVSVDFNDQETYEYLFKEYWEDLKRRLHISLPQLDKDGRVVEGTFSSMNGISDTESEKEDDMSDSEKEPDEEDPEEESSELPEQKRGKTKLNEAPPHDADFEGGEEDEAELDQPVTREFEGWASKELIDFVKFMDQDATKALTRFAMNKLLWIYIKRQDLQDPQTKSKILCDERLRTIFGKREVGQSEIIKLLERHYAPKEKKSKPGKRPSAFSASSYQPPAVVEDVHDEPEMVHDDRMSKPKDKRKAKKKEEFVRPNLNDYAAVNRKNIELIYLKRTLLEFLLDDPDFTNKAMSAFVRIRVPGMTSKTEMCYRLVQVIGTKSQPDLYKAGRKMTNIVLEILNLQKKEEVTVDLVSNQDFTEEECQRLRQSIKCGFIKAPTVGELEEKAMALQAAKFNDWFESEQLRLSSLRDRASETGRKKELRECVEKLKELNSPAFRAAKLQQRPEVVADPHMDPGYESDVADDKHGSDPDTWEKGASGFGRDKDTDDRNLDDYLNRKGDRESHRSKSSSHDKRGRAKDWDSSHKLDPPPVTSHMSCGPRISSGLIQVPSESDAKPEREKKKSTWDKDLWRNQRDRDQTRDRSSGPSWKANEKSSSLAPERWYDMSETPSSRTDPRVAFADNTAAGEQRAGWAWKKEPLSSPTLLPSVSTIGAAPAGQLTASTMETLEKERVWHYRDPTGTVQGPFSMEQLRKWNTTGLFPVDLRIWKLSQPDNPILLIDGLSGSSLRTSEVRNSVAQSNAVSDYGIQIQSSTHFPLTGSVAGINGSISTRLGESWPENGGGVSSWTGRETADSLGRVTSWGGSIGGDRGTSRAAAVDWESASSRPETTFQPRVKPEGGLWSPTDPDSLQKDMEMWPSSGRGAGNGGWNSKGVERTGGSGSRSPPRASGGWNSSPDSGNGRASWTRSHDDEYTRRDSSRISRISSAREASAREARKDTPCKFYKNGYCKRGDTCHFMH